VYTFACLYPALMHDRVSILRSCVCVWVCIQARVLRVRMSEWGAALTACSSRAQDPRLVQQRNQHTIFRRVGSAHIACVSAHPLNRPMTIPLAFLAPCHPSSLLLLIPLLSAHSLLSALLLLSASLAVIRRSLSSLLSSSASIYIRVLHAHMSMYVCTYMRPRAQRTHRCTYVCLHIYIYTDTCAHEYTHALMKILVHDAYPCLPTVI